MKKLISICALIILLAGLPAVGFPSPGTHTVPYETLEHLIVVKTGIDGSDRIYNFVVDTGGLTFVDAEVARNLGLKQQGSMAKITNLELPGFSIEKVFAFTNFDFGHLAEFGTPLHGIIGSNLLERFRVTFDFASSIIIFSADTTSLRYADGDFLLPFRNHPVNNAPMVDIRIGGETAEGMIDTGQPHALVLPLVAFEFFEKNAVSGFIKSRGLMREWPMTEADHNYLARMETFELGDLRMSDVLCLFAELPPLLSVPLIGNNLLSRFKMIIDYPRNELLLVPYGDDVLESNIFSVGLSLDVSDAGIVFVKGLWEESPADSAGIMPGDKVISFESRVATQENLIELMRLMREDSIRSIRLEIERAGEQRTVTLDKAILF